MLGFTRVRTVCQERQRCNPQSGRYGGGWGGNLVGIAGKMYDGGFINRGFLASNLSVIFVMPFFDHFIDFGSPLGSILAPFSIILASLFRASFLHRFSTNCGTDVDLIFDGLLVIFSFAHSPRTKPREACF